VPEQATRIAGTPTSRRGKGWLVLPSSRTTRWWLPRGPRRVARSALSVYQPVTLKGRLGWEAARLAAAFGGFRFTPRVDKPPSEVHELVTPILPLRSTYAVMRSRHVGRFVALLISSEGYPSLVVKLATDKEGTDALAREARALRTAAPALPNGVHAPRLVDARPGILLFEAVQWRPRARPWRLPGEVSAALGFLWRAGFVHGDCAPWNLLRSDDGWVLCDWEATRKKSLPFEDVFHYLVQSCALLGWPSRQALFRGLRGRGWIGVTVDAFAKTAGLASPSPIEPFVAYLHESLRRSDSTDGDGRRAVATRRALLSEIAESP